MTSEQEKKNKKIKPLTQHHYAATLFLFLMSLQIPALGKQDVMVYCICMIWKTNKTTVMEHNETAKMQKHHKK